MTKTELLKLLYDKPAGNETTFHGVEEGDLRRLEDLEFDGLITLKVGAASDWAAAIITVPGRRHVEALRG